MIREELANDDRPGAIGLSTRTSRRPRYDPREGDRDAAAGLALLGIWGRHKKADRAAQQEARRRLHQTLFPCDSAVLESKGERDWKSATTTARSPDPLTKLAATLDPTAQMGFPRLLSDRTRQIADGIGSARRGEQLSRRAFISSLCIRGSPVGRYHGILVVTLGVQAHS